MTTTEARTLAQSDPVPNLTQRFGETAELARMNLNHLVTNLRDLDKLQEQLGDRNVTVDVDLGPIGEAAKAARRDLERQRDTPTFELPR